MSVSDRDQPCFDVVIVGASFAGLLCARTAAMRGLKVCVLEAKADPGARIHTTGILVKEAADEVDLPHDLMRRVHGVRLYAPNLKSIDLFAPGSYFLTTRTADIVRWLAREAERAGAAIMCGRRFAGADRDGDLIRIGSHGLTTRYLVGADGARSSVAECFGLGRNSRFLTGIESRVRPAGRCRPAVPALLHRCQDGARIYRLDRAGPGRHAGRPCGQTGPEA